MNNIKILELVLNVLPFSNQITDIDVSSEDDAIRFTWRSKRFRVSSTLLVEEVNGSTLSGSDIAIIFRELLQVNSRLKR